MTTSYPQPELNMSPPVGKIDMPAAKYSAQTIAQWLGRNQPTAEQTEVIEAPLAPILVVAGAGSGKTETMASRVIYLVANGFVQPREILGLTFTRKATAELQERITARLQALATAMKERGETLPPGLDADEDALTMQRPHVATYNGFALNLVQEHALRLGLDPDLKMLGASAAWQLAYDIALANKDLHIDASTATIASAIISLSSSLADHLLDPDNVAAGIEKYHDFITGLPLSSPEDKRTKTTPAPVKKILGSFEERLLLIDLVKQYQQAKAELGAADYSDQITYAAQLAENSQEVVEIQRELYKVVLLDEFQDTSIAQLRFLTGLFGDGHATCAVGDPQQAIYSWRGASAGSLTKFAELCGNEEKPVLQLQLSTSWRNDKAILDVANAVSAPLRADKQLNIPKLSPRPGAGGGSVSVAGYVTAAEEAAAVAEWIKHKLENGTLDNPSAAILVRSRNELTLMAKAVQAVGLTPEIFGMGGLVNKPEVADVRAVLVVVANPDRNDWMMRLLTGPKYRLGTRDLAVLGDWKKDLARRAKTISEIPVNLVDAIDDLPLPVWENRDGYRISKTGYQRLTHLRDLLRDLRRRLNLPLGDLVLAAATGLGLDVELSTVAAANENPLRDLEAFRRHAEEYENSTLGASLEAYLALVEVSETQEFGLTLAAQDSDGADEVSAGSVAISTMHSAKGLEWDYVAIAGFAEGALPKVNNRIVKVEHPGTGEKEEVRKDWNNGWIGSLSNAEAPWNLRGDNEMLPEFDPIGCDTQKDVRDHLADFQHAAGDNQVLEARRVAYVALTRARSDLKLSWSAYKDTAVKPRERSRFITEVLKSLQLEAEVSDIPEANPNQAEEESAVYPPQASAQQHQQQNDAAAIAACGDEELAALREKFTDTSAKLSPLAQATKRYLEDLSDLRGAQEVYSGVRVSTSELMYRAEDPEGSALALLRPLPRKPSPEALRGTAFHAWVENTLGTAALFDLDEIPAYTADEVDLEAEKALREKFAASIWANQQPICLEEGVFMQQGPYRVRGIIDAVFPGEALAAVINDPGTVDLVKVADAAGKTREASAADLKRFSDAKIAIVDWKTGHVPTGKALKNKSLQLAIYREAWHRRSGIPMEDIVCAFYYVASGETLLVEVE